MTTQKKSEKAKNLGLSHYCRWLLIDSHSKGEEGLTGNTSLQVSAQLLMWLALSRPHIFCTTLALQPYGQISVNVDISDDSICHQILESNTWWVLCVLVEASSQPLVSIYPRSSECSGGSPIPSPLPSLSKTCHISESSTNDDPRDAQLLPLGNSLSLSLLSSLWGTGKSPGSILPNKPVFFF